MGGRKQSRKPFDQQEAEEGKFMRRVVMSSPGWTIQGEVLVSKVTGLGGQSANIKETSSKWRGKSGGKESLG